MLRHVDKRAKDYEPISTDKQSQLNSGSRPSPFKNFSAGALFKRPKTWLLRRTKSDNEASGIGREYRPSLRSRQNSADPTVRGPDPISVNLPEIRRTSVSTDSQYSTHAVLQGQQLSTETASTIPSSLVRETPNLERDLRADDVSPLDVSSGSSPYRRLSTYFVHPLPTTLEQSRHTDQSMNVTEDPQWARGTREGSCSSVDSLCHGRTKAVLGNAADMAAQFSDELKRRAEGMVPGNGVPDDEYRIV